MSRGPRYRRAKAVTPARRLLISTTTALAVLGAAALLLGIWAVWTFAGPGPRAREGQSTTVILRTGAGLPEIASTLRAAHVISSGPIFVAASELTGAAKHMKAGEYEFRSGASMATVIARIRDGKVVRHLITIPEGVPSVMVAEILQRADFLTGSAPEPPEGSVLPETYEARRGEDRAAVLQRMMDARDKLLASLWTQRRTDLPYQSPDQAVILASIVEKETAKPDERPRIAAVFVNRLQHGMRLESDPTIIYGLTRGRPLGHGITAQEKNTHTPYNTYFVDGLPPTPIGNPGRASLAAALDPPRTDELFFVADGTGGHVFSSTVDQHNENVKRWREIEKARAAAHPPAAAAPAKGR
ncbi:MAG TPA: endolytic transglycosylase MltG [Caulobacteraceae bacterium]|nr:endolytic transglycosylase MltG [Caulobacteraceae bacterium]